MSSPRPDRLNIFSTIFFLLIFCFPINTRSHSLNLIFLRPHCLLIIIQLSIINHCKTKRKYFSRSFVLSQLWHPETRFYHSLILWGNTWSIKKLHEFSFRARKVKVLDFSSWSGRVKEEESTSKKTGVQRIEHVERETEKESALDFGKIYRSFNILCNWDTFPIFWLLN